MIENQHNVKVMDSFSTKTTLFFISISMKFLKYFHVYFCVSEKKKNQLDKVLMYMHIITYYKYFNLNENENCLLGRK